MEKLGVFWHTQGAGKSYSMVMFTRKVHRKIGGNFTFWCSPIETTWILDLQDLRGGAWLTTIRFQCRASWGNLLSQLLAVTSLHLLADKKFNQKLTREDTNQRDDIS
jgi:type I restriction enzyme R subunit